MNICALQRYKWHMEEHSACSLLESQWTASNDDQTTRTNHDRSNKKNGSTVYVWWNQEILPFYFILLQIAIYNKNESTHHLPIIKIKLLIHIFLFKWTNWVSKFSDLSFFCKRICSFPPFSIIHSLLTIVDIDNWFKFLLIIKK